MTVFSVVCYGNKIATFYHVDFAMNVARYINDLWGFGCAIVSSAPYSGEVVFNGDIASAVVKMFELLSE